MTNSVTKMDSRVVEEDAVAADEATDEFTRRKTHRKKRMNLQY